LNHVRFRRSYHVGVEGDSQTFEEKKAHTTAVGFFLTAGNGHMVKPSEDQSRKVRGNI